MLMDTLDRITKENKSTVLRRSAGIPPTIISILRAEPPVVKNNRANNKKKGTERKTEQSDMLNMTLEFLLKLASEAEKGDSKIHAFNIMKFIFTDSILLREHINRYVTPAMILATKELQSDNWSIRNSALMCFTSLIKCLLN